MEETKAASFEEFKIYKIDQSGRRIFRLWEDGAHCGDDNEPAGARMEMVDLAEVMRCGRAEDTYLVEVIGGSMTDADILPGDLLVIRNQEPANGDIVAVNVNGDTHIKFYMSDSDRNVMFFPANTGYQPITVTPDMRVEIYGVVVSKNRPQERATGHFLGTMKRKVTALRKLREAEQLAPFRKIVEAILPDIMQKQDWYFVFRAMAEKGRYEQSAYSAFLADLRQAGLEDKDVPSKQRISDIGSAYGWRESIAEQVCPEAVREAVHVRGLKIARKVANFF